MAVDVGSAKGYLDLDISGFLAGLRTAQDEASSVSKNIVTKFGDDISKAGKGLTSAGTTLTKSLTVPIMSIGVVGLKTAMSFEKGMSEVQAISGATGEEFDALKEKAIDLGATTAFSASEVTEAMLEMAKAGWNNQQILDGLGGVLDAAAASGEGLGSVATIVADAITGFGLEASDSTKVADLLTQAANSGTIGMNDLGESFKYIAPVAGTMGFTIEDVTTAITAMSMAGIKGSQAGTSLRGTLSRLVKPTDQVAAAMDTLGIVLTNEDGTFKSLDTIVSEMRGSFSGLTDEQKTYYATVLAGQEGMSGLLSLLNLTEEEYNAIAESMDNSGGVAQETATIMQDNLQSKVEQLGGSLESLAIKLGDLVIPYIQQFVEWLTSLVDKFTALDPETQKTILKFAGLTAVVGPVLVVFGKLVGAAGTIFTTFGKIPGAITKLTTGFTGMVNATKRVADGFRLAKAGFTALGSSASPLGAALAGITAPMIAIVAVVAAVIAAFVSLWKNNEEFRNNITAIWNQIKETFSNFAQGIVDRLNALGFDFSSITEVLKAVWEGFCNFLAPIFEGVFQYIADTLQVILDVILGIFGFWISIFKGDWQGAWDEIKGIFESIWNGIVAWFQNIGNTLLGILDVVCGWFGTTWSDTWTSIQTFFVNIWNSIVTWFQTALTNIATFFTDLWNGIVSFFTGVWEGIKNIVQFGIMFIVSILDAAFQLITLPFRFIWENCKETIIAAWESIKTTVTNALNAISEFISRIWNGIKSFLQPILTTIATFVSTTWNNIKTGVSNALNAIKTLVTNAFNTVKTFITNIWNGIKTITTNVWNGIKEAISVPINAAKTLISNIVNSIKTAISNGFNSAKATVSSVFDSIKNKITNVMNSARDIVKGAIDRIKSFFNFSWSLPHLKMPHFSISGSFSLNPPSVPRLSISWYKKAMSGGMILNSPTIFGYDAASGQFLGGGEAGSETVVGTSSLMTMIRQAVADAIKPIIAVTHQLAKASNELGYITYNSFARQAQTFEKVAAAGVLGGGDTFNFYSPKAIDEIEAAKQMKKAKRDLAEGF